MSAEVRATNWGWHHNTRRNFAVRGLNLVIPPGQKVLLLGASGAGKSTFLHALAGVLGSDQGAAEGELTVAGVPAAAARGRVGLVLQDPLSQIIVGRVGDDVAFGPESLGIARPEIWRRVQDCLAAVDLEVPLTRPTSALSGGQMQRLALAGVMAMQPQVLALDEPTANLDPEGVLQVRDAVLRAQSSSGATLLVVEHRVSTWWDHVDRVIVLGRGQGVIADGEPRQVLAQSGAELLAQGVWVPDRPPAKTLSRPEARSEWILRAQDLSIGYSPQHPVLEGINLSIPAGMSTCIVGENGAGKSTLALTLAGLLPALGGRVEAAASLREPLPDLDPRPRWGHRPAPLPPDPHDWQSRHLLTRLGTVFQSPEHQFVTASVLDELVVGQRALGIDPALAQERALEVLRRLGLEKLGGANPFTLSGGEKRRLSVASALVTSPRVLFLDEPTFGQDYRTWRELLALLQDLVSEGVTLVSVTHDRDFIAAMAQNLVRVSVGQVSEE